MIAIHYYYFIHDFFQHTKLNILGKACAFENKVEIIEG